ncbi:MAG TPA: Hsp20/alpha crystallin family protein [Clostridiaceae bacterium]|nr:Hsp20/alpha crystallin family protein [Clostridiaceae bacterium]
MFGLTPYNRNRRRRELPVFNDFMDIRSFFDNFFDDAFFPGFFSVGNPIRADIRETDKEYIIDAELPGVRKEDIKLELRDDVLTIAVEHNEEINEERENYIRRERRRGSFSRSFYVENVKHENVTAKFNNGILTVILPKSDEGKRRGWNIEIQ